MLEFIYCDQCDIHLENALLIFQAADRFGLDKLKKEAEVVIVEALSVCLHAHSLSLRCTHYLIETDSCLSESRNDTHAHIRNRSLYVRSTCSVLSGFVLIMLVGNCRPHIRRIGSVQRLVSS